MDVLIALLFNGVVSGGIIALMAVAFAIVYAATGYFHIAQAGVFSAASYGLLMGSRMELPFVIAVLFAVTVGTAFGLLIDHILYRPLERKGTSRLMMLIASLATVIVTDNVLAIFFTQDPQFISVAGLKSRLFGFGLVNVTRLQALGLVVALIGVALLYTYLARTRQGRAIRGSAGNPDLARSLGLPLGKLQTRVFLLSSALASLTGAYYALEAGALPYRGLGIFLIASIAVIAGGVGSITGAALAAFVIGIVQSLALAVVPAQWSTAIVFTMFIVWIVVKPEGLARATTRAH